MEPVTQKEDVPAQLVAEKARIEEKIERAKERRRKALGDDQAVDRDPTSDSHVVHKERVAIWKQKCSDHVSPHRSPHVPGTVEGGTRQSPRLIGMQKARTSPRGNQAASKVKKLNPKVVQPVVKVITCF
jgi:hypothetical protein